MRKITVEELDIIVQASVEQALSEFKKIVPQLKKTIKQVEDDLNNMDTKGMTNKVQQAVKQIKQKINEVKNTGVDRQLQSQFDRAGASVQKYQWQLNQTKEKLRQLYNEMDNIQANTWKAYTPEGIELGNESIEPAVNNDLAKNKQYQSLSKEVIKLEGEIASLNTKLNTTKQEYTQIGSQIQQTTSKQSMWNNVVNKVKTSIAGLKKNTNSTGSAFESVANISEKVKNGCSQILKITGRVVTKIRQIGTGFKQGLTHILKYAGALFSLQTIYSALSSSANAWLSSQNAQAQQLQANIDYLKNSFGSVLAPVIEYIVNLVYQLMKAIQSVVYALSGVNIFANASAKAYSSMAGSAKEANKETKQLAGVHSELNNIQSNEGGSSGSGGGIATPSFDLSQLDSQMSPLAQKLYDFFKPLVDSWNMYGASLVEQVKLTASQIGELLSAVWGSFEKIITNGTIYAILGNILAIIGKIAQAWANAWTYNNNGDVIVQNLANAFNNLLVSINNVVSSPEFQEWLNNCSDKFREISEKIGSIDWQPLVDALFEIGSTIGTVALNILSGLVDVFKWLAENPAVAEVLLAIAVAIGVVSTAISIVSSVMAILNPILQTTEITLMPLIGIIVGIMAGLAALIAVVILVVQNWEWLCEQAQIIWNAIAEFFTNLWQGICNTATNIWNGIKDFFVNIWTGISTFFSNIWNGIKNVAMTIWNAITTVISNVINDIRNTISNVLNAISTVWNNIWNSIKNVVVSIWNGIWGAIKSVINSILGGIESFVNGVIRGINWVLGGISKVANAVGSLIGLDPINLQLSTISLPRLAKGAVLRVPTIAEMAEYPGASTNPEIVTPQNIMEETFDRVLSRYQDRNNSQPIYLTVNVGNRKLGQILLDDLKDKKRRSGKGIEALVGG